MEFCLNFGKPLLKQKGKFCNSSCAAVYNNLNRKTTTKGKTKFSKCIKCGKEIEVSIHINKSKIICNECSELKKQKRPHYKNVKNLFDCSKRTISKIIKRANIKCALCGWNEASCDIHHIIPKKYGGTDSHDNLIIVCPNCHRKIHTLNIYSEDFLRQYSIDKTFENWKDFYHISN